MSIISDNFREFWRQEAQNPVAMENRIKYLVENPRTIDGLYNGTLAVILKSQAVELALAARKPTNVFSALLAIYERGDGHCNPGFTESRWPLEPVASDEEDWEVVEHYFMEKVTVEEGLRRLAEMADRGEIRLLTGSRRALKWVAAHMDAQLDHSFILPLRAQNDEKEWKVPVFSRRMIFGEYSSSLNLFRLEREVDPSCSWLVLCKHQPSSVVIGQLGHSA